MRLTSEGSFGLEIVAWWLRAWDETGEIGIFSRCEFRTIFLLLRALGAFFHFGLRLLLARFFFSSLLD
jgi:hypothetical protein